MTVTPPETPPAVRPPFSAAAFIGGLFLTLFTGAIGNVLAGMVAMSFHTGAAGAATGALPGILFVALGLALQRRNSPGFGLGLVVGGAIIALIGGACAAGLVGANFH